MAALGVAARALVASLALAGCAGIGPDGPAVNAVLAGYPGAERQIRDYYEANAAEDNYGCGPVDMGVIVNVKVLEDTPERVRLALHYTFSSETLEPRKREACTDAFNTRIVAFAREGGTLRLTGMTGELR